MLKSAVHFLELSIARGDRGENASSSFVSGQRRQHLHRECQDATTITFHLSTALHLNCVILRAYLPDVAPLTMSFDPFEARMQFLQLLRKLNASQQSIHKVVGYAIKYGSKCGEDLWECILEECGKVGLLLAVVFARFSRLCLKRGIWYLWRTETHD